MTPARCLPLLAVLLAASPGARAAGGSGEPELVWNARNAEHLLNRAGFGGPPEEIQRLVELGAEAAVDELLGGVVDRGSHRLGETGRELRAGLLEPPDLTDGPRLGAEPPAATTERFYLDRGRREALGSVRDYCAAWIESMLRGDDPARDRMTIFWHGHFVSAFEIIQDDRDMIRQIDLLREGALGDFGALVRSIARDPAMLEYLNNNTNEKSHPNENWARELMELFTLGEGNHYTEDDIKEAARAFTGWANRDHRFVYNRYLHDYGFKEVLGVHGNLDGDDVVDVLLEHPGTARFVAWKVISYLEGGEPDSDRVEEYAARLRDSGYDVAAFLRHLFLDSAFYRDEVRGARVAAPVEYFVGLSRRLGVDPPPNLVFFASSLLGQRLFDPPNVKGWEEGMPWMTTGGVMQRSNLVRAFLGLLGAGSDDGARTATQEFESIVALRGREFTGPYRDYLAMRAWFEETDWKPPRMGFADALREEGVSEDEVLVARTLERLLAVPSVGSSVERVSDQLREWRAEAGLAEGPLLDAGEETDELLVRLAHLVLSLPEAQLN